MPMCEVKKSKLQSNVCSLKINELFYVTYMSLYGLCEHREGGGKTHTKLWSLVA